MTENKYRLGQLNAVLKFGLLALVMLTLSRLGLCLWQAGRVTAVNGWLPVIAQGIRVDFSTLCWLFGIAAFGTVMLGGLPIIGRIWYWLVRLWLVAGVWVLAVMEITTPSFIAEYGLRPNRLYVEYLIYPKEVFSMLWASHRFEMVLTVVLGTLFAAGLWWLSGRWLRRDNMRLAWYWRILAGVVILVVTLLGGRSSLEHRPLNPAMVAFSTDPLVNSLTLNSAYSLLFAIKQMGDEADAAKIYGAMAKDDMIAMMQRESGRHDFIDPARPSLTFNPASYHGKPKNLVILLQESLGAQFVGSLGGLPLTPNLDKLGQEGWYFNQMYATGTRSVRGIEAVVTGFTPTPARSVVKLGKSQTGFFTLAGLLKQHGYHTQFIYGGESHFDNMRSFFLGNGFEDIVDEGSYDNPVFQGSWGVSDEDLMRRANQEFESLHAAGKPFFSLVFSSSNHDPFEFPDNRISLYEQPKNTRNNAAKYADYAIGEFFKLAKKSSYWDDTLFLIVADHDSRVVGADLIPVPRFRIPGLIIGKDIAPKQDTRIVSQLDMAPTMLSLMGISDKYPMIGRDLTRMPANWPGRAMMQYDKNFGYMQGNELVVLQPGKAPSGFAVDNAGKLTPHPASDALKQQALGIALWGSYAYQHGLYH